MKFRAISFAFVVAAVFTSLVSADCTDILRLSRLSRTEVRDESDIASYARTFCGEYDSIKQGHSSASAGLAYSVLSASFSSGSASYDAVHSRYCDSVNQSSARNDTFRSYIESMAPGTYEAYNQCKKLEGIGVQISVQQASVLPLSLAMTVSFSSGMQGQQTISFAASPDVTCQWLNGAKGDLKLKNGGSSLLKCARSAADSASFVQVIATTSPDATFAFPWSRFENGLPADELGSLRAELARSVQALNSAVVAFDLKECPMGWKEYVPAQGRFIRGIDKGNGVDPEKNRNPGSFQEDTFASHTHTRPQDVYNAGGQKPDEGAACGNCQGYAYTGPPTTGATGGDETRPRNVALLYCTPDNR